MSKWHLIENQPLLRENYKDPPLLSYRKGRSLENELVRAKLWRPKCSILTNGSRVWPVNYLYQHRKLCNTYGLFWQRDAIRSILTSIWLNSKQLISMVYWIPYFLHPAGVPFTIAVEDKFPQRKMRSAKTKKKGTTRKDVSDSKQMRTMEAYKVR